ncbi:MAG: GerAB/ArcD/ProY family transporter [Lachnospiraceae bacterium]|nr:GerAB/ArcD/ProY family transporter [Lachnospiraceae bacterium]
MFSNNGEISNHQMVRLLILDVFTGAALFLPSVLGKLAGGGGLLALFLGILLTLADGAFIAWSQSRQGVGGQIWRCLCGIRCVAVLLFLMGLFIAVLEENFLYMMPKWLITAGMVLVLIYIGTKGIEVRSRMSEILFYIVLIPILLIGFFSIPEGNFTELSNFSQISVNGVLEGSLVTWVVLAPAEWLIYIFPKEKTKGFFKIFAWSVGIGGGLTAVIYGLCTAVLSVSGMVGERWPTVILMQIVRIPGGFMSRQDGLMLSFWIFAMFISLSGALNHGIRLLKKEGAKANLWEIGAAAIGGGILSSIFGMDGKFLEIYFWGMILSGIARMCLLPLVKGFKGKKKAVSCLVILLMVGLVGCENYTELENRAFAMALGVDEGEVGDYMFTYTFPDLSTLTGNGGGVKYPAASLEGDSLAECKEKYDSMSNKTLDYGQLKVLVLGKNIVENKDVLNKLLEEIKGNPEFARTVLVCESITSAAEILGLDEEVEGSIGIYLDEQFRNNGNNLGVETIILNDLLLEPAGEGGKNTIPKLCVYDKKPRILQGFEGF